MKKKLKKIALLPLRELLFLVDKIAYREYNLISRDLSIRKMTNGSLNLIRVLVNISDGHSEHVAHASRKYVFSEIKINQIGDGSRFDQMPLTDQITKIVLACIPIFELPSM